MLRPGKLYTFDNDNESSIVTLSAELVGKCGRFYKKYSAIVPSWKRQKMQLNRLSV